MTKKELVSLINESEKIEDDPMISREEQIQMQVEGILSQIGDSDSELYVKFCEFSSNYEDAYDNFDALKKFAETL